MGLFDPLIRGIFAGTIQREVRQALALAETDNTFTAGAFPAGESPRDRLSPDRNESYSQAMEAWRVNPLARRMVALTSQYVVGGGVSISCKHRHTNFFLGSFWHHRLNHMPVRVYEWCDELTRTGNLFLLVSTDRAGMSYVRAVPADQIEAIIPAANDLEQPLAFKPRPSLDQPDPLPWPAYNELTDRPSSGSSASGFPAVMLHYAVNRPVGAQWGESDLAPLLRWLSRYAGWLEDRARLNRFRTAFLYVVKNRFSSEAERLSRQRSLNSSPPTPGSILVTDTGEEWSVINPQLHADDAGSDGLALKKMIASGAGVPLHFLAEPESATRTTAEAAGGPTFRHYEQRQKFFLWMLGDLLKVVLNRRAYFDRAVQRYADLEVTAGDISARDNISLAMAASNLVSALEKLRERALIDDSELLRMLYRFLDEPVNVEEMLERGRKAGPAVTGSDGVTLPGNPLDAGGDLKPSATGETSKL